MKKIVGTDNIKNLFKDLKISYISEYIIEIDDLLKQNFYDSEYYLDNLDEFEELSRIYGESIKNRVIADLYIDKTVDRGYGLFANKSFKEGDFIGVYIGVIREEDDFVPYDETGFDTDYAWDFPDDTLDLANLEINAKYYGNELRFANHGESPNLRVEHTVVNNMWYIFFLAGRDILKDEELTISYGDAYWDTEYRDLS